jgi:GntR family transcriptional regulator
MNAALPLPKYHQIYLVLREQLHEGRYLRGMPAETALSKQFAAGRVTVRRALEQLAGEGLIVRQAGRGTRPVRPGPDPTAHPATARPAAAPSRLTGLLQNIVSMSQHTSVKVLEFKTIRASEEVAQALQVAPGARVVKVVRRRALPEGPLSHITAFLPLELARRFGRRELANKPILRLLEESGVELGRAQQTVSARQADAQVAAQLEVAVGTALLAVQRLVFDIHERPVQWLHGLYRPDRYQYQMEVSQVGSIDAKVSVKENLSSVRPRPGARRSSS